MKFNLWDTFLSSLSFTSAILLQRVMNVCCTFLSFFRTWSKCDAIPLTTPVNTDDTFSYMSPWFCCFFFFIKTWSKCGAVSFFKTWSECGAVLLSPFSKYGVNVVLYFFFLSFFKTWSKYGAVPVNSDNTASCMSPWREAAVPSPAYFQMLNKSWQRVQ